ncbi:MAG: chitin deacetylase family protein [Gemmatimonadales bacterium]
MAVVLVSAAAAVLGVPPPWVIDRLARRFPGCLYRVATDEPVIALTLDDGPDAVTTARLLEELRQHSARATFFLIADRVPGREQLVRRIVAEGHELGNHLTQDRPSIRLSSSEFATDLQRAAQVLAPFAPVHWVRPGSGWYSQTMIETIQRAGYRCALGSVYPLDASIPSVGFARWYILHHVRPGAIVLLHDGGARGRRTARVLGDVLPELRRRGYQVVSLSELVAAAQPAHGAGGPESRWRARQRMAPPGSKP